MEFLFLPYIFTSKCAFRKRASARSDTKRCEQVILSQCKNSIRFSQALKASLCEKWANTLVLEHL